MSKVTVEVPAYYFDGYEIQERSKPLSISIAPLDGYGGHVTLSINGFEDVVEKDSLLKALSVLNAVASR